MQGLCATHTLVANRRIYDPVDVKAWQMSPEHSIYTSGIELRNWLCNPNSEAQCSYTTLKTVMQPSRILSRNIVNRY